MSSLAFCVPAKMEENTQYLIDLKVKSNIEEQEEQNLDVILFICSFLEQAF